ncbi:MAG: sialate O-acetylesterase [Pseudomonadota bacterium]|nr:sialate O-acetylesterase [Pseudomonadota bacterium]
MLQLFLGCASAVSCGPGTHEVEALCLPDAVAADTAPVPDTGDTAEEVEEQEFIEVYLLSGQSNMDGFSLLSGLPPSLRVAQADVPLYWAETGTFAPLAPASSYGAPYTGPEVSFGRTLADAGQRVALVKYAIGASNLQTYWTPGKGDDDPDAGEGWAVLVETIAGATAELDAAGTPWRWAGFVWMQGETDARYAATAAAYEANLTQLLASVREETNTPELPTVLGLIACDEMCEWFEDVRTAQIAVADADPNTVAVETFDLPLSVTDEIHYDGPSIRVVGERFAQALLGVPLSAPPTAAMAIAGHETTSDGDYTVGWRFQTDRPIVVTDVGGFAVTTFHTSPEWGLWETTTETLLARGTIPGRFEEPTTLRDGFWYAGVEPIALPAGDYVIGLMIWQTDGNVFTTDAIGVTAEGITLVEPRSIADYWLTFPTDAAGVGTGMAYLGPSFLYHE